MRPQLTERRRFLRLGEVYLHFRMVYIPKGRRVWHFMTLGLCVACGIFAAPRAWSQPVTFSIPSDLQIVRDDAEFEAAKRAVDDLREALLHAKPVIDLQTGFYHDSDRNTCSITNHP